MSLLDLCAVLHLPVHLAFRLLHRSQARETFFLFFPVRELRSGLMEGFVVQRWMQLRIWFSAAEASLTYCCPTTACECGGSFRSGAVVMYKLQNERLGMFA